MTQASGWGLSTLKDALHQKFYHNVRAESGICFNSWWIETQKNRNQRGLRKLMQPSPDVWKTQCSFKSLSIATYTNPKVYHSLCTGNNKQKTFLWLDRFSVLSTHQQLQLTSIHRCPQQKQLGNDCKFLWKEEKNMITLHQIMEKTFSLFHCYPCENPFELKLDVFHALQSVLNSELTGDL